jgi:ElaB/YqjD/DUF883 family membrane-anchored ribosome-binding protein
MQTFEATTLDHAALRKETIQAHEVPALFESVADIAGVADTDETGESTNSEGVAVNAYGSPLSLWELKRGLLTPALPTERSTWSFVKWGVCTAATNEMGATSRKPEGVAVRTDNARVSSRVDSEVSLDLGQTWEPLLAKNVGNMSIDMWRNATGDWVVPEAVMLECQHHCYVRGCARVHVAALFGGLTVRRFIVERDEELVADIADAIAAFWKAVDAGRRPAASGKRDQKVIARLNAVIDPTEEVIDLRGDRGIEKLLNDKAKIDSEIKALEASLEEINNALRARMDGVASAIVSDTHQLRWIKQPAQEVSYSKPASAHLRVTKIAKKAAGRSLEDLANQT